jgi:predicted dehydrogenase
MEPSIAAVGAGAWGKNIVRTLHQMGALHSIVEPSPALRDAASTACPGVPAVSHISEILGNDSIRAVTLATPAPTHHSLAKACLLAGKDVFVEKPMTLTAAEAEDLVTTADQLGRVLMTGHLLLYKPAVVFLRNWLAAGHLGRIFSYHQERMKLGKARAVENALWSLGVHDVAALLFIANATPSHVSFSGHCGLQPGIEDDTYLHMTFPDGRAAHLHNSWLWPEDRRGLRIIGELGMLSYDEKSESVTLHRKTIDHALNHSDAGAELLFSAPQDFQALRAELEHFTDCINSRATPRSCGRNGLDVIRVLERAAAPPA